MLKQSASNVLEAREASFVSGFIRTFYVSSFTNDKAGLLEHPA
jgi:hypothetical protein